ncbi:MAG: hypothetical protein FJW29_03030 [Acidobacteria bacterium]|nr:hypothetical protein [Acidobacteriota bacterium]
MHPDDEFLKAMAGDPQVRRLRRGGPERVAARPVAPEPDVALAPPTPGPPSLSARLHEAEEARDAERAEAHAAQAQVRALAERLSANEVAAAEREAAHDALHRQLAEAQAARQTLETDRKSLLGQIGSLHEQLTQARDRAAAADAAARRAVPLWDVLEALALPSPVTRFAQALAHVEPSRADKTVRHLFTSQPDELRHLLTDKVAWVCAGCRSGATHECVIEVAPEDCDVCGGSSIVAAARRFTDACRRADCRRVLIVGGSPRYHAQLTAALQADGLELTLVEGNRKLPAAQARQLCDRAHRGFIWGPTILDHAVSGLFQGSRIQTVHVRGITRFLDEAARLLGQPVATR